MQEEKIHEIDKETAVLKNRVDTLEKIQREIKEEQKSSKIEFKGFIDEIKDDSRHEENTKLSKIAIIITIVGVSLSVILSIIGFFIK